MSRTYKKITSEDYVLDMIEVINQNFDSISKTLDDLDEIVNDGDLEIKSLTINENGEDTDESLYNKGTFVNTGNADFQKKIKAKELEVNSISNFNGISKFNENVEFKKDVVFDGDLTSFNETSFRKALRVPSRIVDTIEKTGHIGEITDTYNMPILNDVSIILDEASSNFGQGMTYNLINAKENQILLFKVNSVEGSEIFIKLNATNKISLTANDSVTLVWRVTNVENNDGEWVILSFTDGEVLNEKIINI